jgi:eukaryotic-like serine/threonine-protein kinase
LCPAQRPDADPGPVATTKSWENPEKNRVASSGVCRRQIDAKRTAEAASSRATHPIVHARTHRMGESRAEAHRSLSPGDRIGPYEVIAPVGAGGMGEVYRARDDRLHRDVALKIVSPRFALDPARLARFEREAQILAALNHPNIATLYGLEETRGLQALVLELVEGETLADRLASYPTGLPLQEAVGIAQQMAAGLETAHESSIVHRDLKPANIALRPDGTVKLLDFGLARALESTAESDSAGPTITVSQTGIGTVVGTPAYMSPEQARGQTIDKRTDIWSFGVVLYEMLTGRRAFQGETTSDTIAAVLSLEPDWRALPEITPSQVRTLLQRCLEKDPRRRLRDIGDARIELDALIASRFSPANQTAGAEERAGSRKGWSGLRGLKVATAVAALMALSFAAATWLRPRAEPSVGAVQMTALLPPGVSVTSGPGKILSLALSPEGRTLVVAGTDANGQRLYQRTLGRLDATPLAGTEGAVGPFFSPDGAWIGFFADRRLKRVPAGGGASVEIASVSGYPSGASWGTDNRIVFASGYQSPLWVVDSGGGTAEPLTTLTAGLGHRFPHILPDGRTLLFNEGRWIHALDLPSGRRTDRLAEGTWPRYAASGHLILSRQTTLLAAPFDPTRLELTGPVVPIVEGVAVERTSAGVHVAVSSAGTLAYVPAAQAYALVLVEANGSERLLSQAPLLQNPQFSPNGRYLVVATTRRAGEQPDLWMHDLASTAPPSRLTNDGGRAPIWTPDGASITYSRPTPSEGSGIYTRSADGRSDPRPNVPLSNFHWLVGWTPNGILAYGMMEGVAADGKSRSSILAIESSKSRHVIGPGDTWGGRLSHDGRWLAYYLRDSGDFEIYVSPFPNTGTRWLIAEGTDPSWSPDGSEIYYRSGTRLMAARIDTASGVRVLSRRLVIEPFTPPLYDDYDVHPDGKTLALVRPAGDARGREITLVLNWLAELQRIPAR